jgi:hypothetical protein
VEKLMIFLKIYELLQRNSVSCASSGLAGKFSSLPVEKLSFTLFYLHRDIAVVLATDSFA